MISKSKECKSAVKAILILLTALTLAFIINGKAAASESSISLSQAVCNKSSIAEKAALEKNISGCSIAENDVIKSSILNIGIGESYIQSNILLEIRSDDFIYRFIDTLSGSIKFIPQRSGNYSILLINRPDNSIIESFRFGVEDSIKKGMKDTIKKEEEESRPGIEKEGGSRPATSLETRKEAESPIKEQTGRKRYISSEDLPMEDSELSRIGLRDHKNRAVRFNITRKEKNEERNRILRTANFHILSEISAPKQKEGVEDIEILPEDMPVKKIEFNNLDISSNATLGLDNTPEDIKKIDNKDVKEIYAIDPSGLKFSDALVTAKAKGRELYKCKDWDFSGQECYGNWEKILDLTPGKDYNFTLTQQDPAFGETGLPEPHNIEGRVFKMDGTTGVENGIPVAINDTVSGDYVLTYTYAPDIPIFKGSYFAVINGSDGDTLVITSWNSTHYGTNTTTLSATTSHANVVLNTTRPSEANVTITYPENSSVLNTTGSYNVTAEISIIGGKDGFDCNATVSFSDSSVINIDAEDHLTHNLGHIPLGSSINTTWNITVNEEGISNISVRVECSNQTKNFHGVNIDYVYNITAVGEISAVPPEINLISPANNSLVKRNITFLYNVSSSSEISNCSLIINGEAMANKSGIIKNATQNFTLFLGFGNYTYSINCTDNSSGHNTGSSETRLFNVTDMDIAVASSYIIFSRQNPAENEVITINATIRNIGEENATKNFTVQFCEGDPDNGGTQISTDRTIRGLNSSSNNTVSVSWTAKQGAYNIYVLADTPLSGNGSIKESNESNNQANNTVSIPTYHTYYGNISLNVRLSSYSNRSVYLWSNETEISGNIFFIDSDSSITWTNLTALGTNISGKNSTDDFEEIDAALNITGLIGSINATFTSNRYPKHHDSFLVYSSNITNVPVINSTNNSNFITGILWDSSDTNDGEYNGSQDVVFITKLNNNALGRYGTYDYEIKIPANLRRYITPNNDNSLTIYRELTG